MGEPCVVSHSTTNEKARLLLLWGLGSLVRYPVYPAGEIEGGGFPKSEMRALEIPRTLFLAGRRNLSFLPWFFGGVGRCQKGGGEMGWMEDIGD